MYTRICTCVEGLSKDCVPWLTYAYVCMHYTSHACMRTEIPKLKLRNTYIYIWTPHKFEGPQKRTLRSQIQKLPYIYVEYMHVCMVACAHVYMHTHIFMHAYMCTHVYACMYRCTHIYGPCICACMCVYIYMHVYIYAYTCIYIYMHAHFCTCTC